MKIRIKRIRTRAMAYLNRHAIIGLCSKITSTGGYTIQPPLCRFRNSMKQRYILSIFFLLLAISSSAQRTKIFGLVKDDDGQPLELANVRILGTSILTSTNLKGEYTLYCTSRDSVVVVYSQIGYETRKRLLRNPGDSIRLDIVLPAYGLSLIHI